MVGSRTLSLPGWYEAELCLLGAGEQVPVHNGGIALCTLVAVAVAVQLTVLPLPLTTHQVLVAEITNIITVTEKQTISGYSLVA